jgi:tetratricopeptide (TPR) repeat protein
MTARFGRSQPRTVRAVILVFSACVFAAAVPLAGRQDPVTAKPLPPLPPSSAGAADLLFDQGKRLFDAFQYDQAVPVFDRLLAMLTASEPLQRPELATQAYERRARARFALGDSTGAEQDFSALLAIDPAFKLDASVSPRVVAVYESVRRLTVGQIVLSMTPPGEVRIDGRPYTVGAEPLLVDLPVGEHEVSATRPSYRPVTEKIAVVAGTSTPVTVALERVSAKLTIKATPPDVEVLVNGQARGRTAPAAESAANAPAELVLADLAPGTYKLVLRRACYQDVERTITIAEPIDLDTEVLALTAAVASVKVQVPDSAATVFLDGDARGQVPLDFTVCEGPHTIEVRGAKGRFVDRRTWKTGDAVSLTANLRRAFPIVAVRPGTPGSADQLRQSVERALAPAGRVLVYVPDNAELAAALKDEGIPVDWLGADPAAGATAARVSMEARRDFGRRLAGRLQAQGVVALAPGPDPGSVSVSLLASGSGAPDVLVVNPGDEASRKRAIELLGAPLPSLVTASVDAALVDVAGVQGAVVVRAGAAGAKAGLTAGDVIVGATGSPILSVSDLRDRLAAVKPGAGLPLQVRAPGGETRTVEGTVSFVPNVLRSDGSVLMNTAFLDLGDVTPAAASPAEKAAVYLNLAFVAMRLGSWDEARAHLAEVQLPDGPGVAAGTVAYWNGLCFEAVGRTAEARAEFTRAAAAPLARLGDDGPLVAPLAREKLQPRR